MTRDTIKTEIGNASQSLLKMAREMSYNHISDNLSFIIRKMDKEYSQVSSSFEKNVLRKKINDSKSILTLGDTTKELKDCFDDIYEINLYVYKAEKERTIIEVEITEKDKNLYIRNGVPSLHCKVAIPPYAEEGKQKFNINWQLWSWDLKWKMFWWKMKMKQGLNRVKNDT